MQMTIVERSDTLTHLVLEGSLDLVGTGQVSNAFTMQVCTPRKPTIVDMSKVDMVSSLGMGLLVSCSRALAKHQQRLVLVNTQPLVAQAFTNARLDMLMGMAPSVEAAKATLGVA